MLTTYQAIRDRIYEMAHKHNLRPDWVESTPSARMLLLYDRAQTVVARGTVPVRHLTPARLELLRHQLEHVFGKEWME